VLSISVVAMHVHAHTYHELHGQGNNQENAKFRGDWDYTLPNPFVVLHNPLYTKEVDSKDTKTSPTSTSIYSPTPRHPYTGTPSSTSASSSAAASSLSASLQDPRVSKHAVSPCIPQSLRPHFNFSHSLPVLASPSLPHVVDKPIVFEVWSASEDVVDRSRRHWRKQQYAGAEGTIQPKAGYLDLIHTKYGVPKPRSAAETAVSRPYSFADHSVYRHSPASMAETSFSPETNAKLPSLLSKSTFMGIGTLSIPHANIAQLSAYLNAVKVSRIGKNDHSTGPAALVEPPLPLFTLSHCVVDVRDPLSGRVIGQAVVLVRLGSVETMATLQQLQFEQDQANIRQMAELKSAQAPSPDYTAYGVPDDSALAAAQPQTCVCFAAEPLPPLVPAAAAIAAACAGRGPAAHPGAPAAAGAGAGVSGGGLRGQSCHLVCHTDADVVAG
jgi:hypothetical protein